jgi:phosphoribosylaminoimidazole-succinocarboxamide synthase
MGQMPKIYHKGSVKDIRGDEQSDFYIFEYSDRYSVFDWGEMPDLLENKGESLAVMADSFFKFLENPNTWSEWKTDSKIVQEFIQADFYKELARRGVIHNGLGMVDEKLQTLDKGASRYFKVKKIDVLRPKHNNNGQWDYSIFNERPTGCLVPLEVVFRHGLPKGSSLIRRVKKNPNYLNELGISDLSVSDIKEGAIFDSPFLEFSTKLEPEDRYLSNADARAISGMNEQEFMKLINLTQVIALRLKDLFLELGLELWDGKFEFSFVKGDQESVRDFQMVDSIGPDEIRVLYKGAPLSKEFFRQFYLGSSWYEAVSKAKDVAREEGNPDWKKICIEKFQQQPNRLDEGYRKTGESIYTTLANVLSEKFLDYRPFRSVSLEELLTNIAKFIKS